MVTAALVRAADIKPSVLRCLFAYLQMGAFLFFTLDRFTMLIYHEHMERKAQNYFAWFTNSLEGVPAIA